MELSPQQDVYYIDIVSPIDYFIDTVTPSAIQLNKEKTMSIELDGPLYLGSNSLQQQVDQNTEDITELQSDVSSIEGDIGSLDNLATSDKSSLVNAINETLSVLDPTQTADYIKNSKGLESGEISDNASIYPWVEEMSHSTFDLSKFTVVGSPTITDDGIASGLTLSNYFYTNQVSGFDFTNKSWSFKIPTKFNGNTSGNAFIIEGQRDSTTIPNIQIYQNNGGGLRLLNIDAAGGGDAKYSDVQDVPNNNTWCNLEFVYNKSNTTLTCNVYQNDTLYSTSSIANAYALTSLGGFIFGNSDANTVTFDLKGLEIAIDGVPVFSGNKTGIDTIKPDDYTVVGTPTISADGIASGFSNSNRINSYQFAPSSKSWTIKCKCNTGTLISVASSLLGSSNNVDRTMPALDIIDNHWRLFLSSNGSSWDIASQALSSNAVSSNTNYDVELKFTGTQYILIVNGIIEITISSSTPIYTNSYLCIGDNHFADDVGLYWRGSIDLNAFKIYVDGNLVYQPCLKIPYTESKTGSKIVDSIYRDRVEDMYQQFGYAPYYTLDTTNSNYTIPKGEVYGMVNKLVPTLVAPDYSKPVSLTYSSGLVMENDGWLEVQIQSSEATANPYVSINGSIICRTSVNSNGDLNRDTAMMVVRKGDVITSGGYSADTAIVLTYYPFKV